LGYDETYIDEFYNNEEKNVSSDESVASSYEYVHEDNDAPMGDGEKVDEIMAEQVVLSEKCANKDNDESMGDGDKVDEMMVEQAVLSEKCANNDN